MFYPWVVYESESSLLKMGYGIMIKYPIKVIKITSFDILGNFEVELKFYLF